MRLRRPGGSEMKDSRPAVDEEYCMNPRNDVCRSRDILLYIYYGGKASDMQEMLDGDRLQRRRVEIQSE
ncbi:hypothetical protein J7L18_10055 [Candidatus Bathyarchaeota archaeon]|nr:hypothetical protein [Candidatus Bathyarchaeota archaeon]